MVPVDKTANQNPAPTAQASSQAKRRKISVKNVKLSDLPEGTNVIGIFRGIVQGQPFQTVEQKTGAIISKQLQSIILENTTGDRTAYLADKGALQGIADAQVKEGDKIEIVKLAKVQLSKGRTMNQYDIFALED